MQNQVFQCFRSVGHSISKSYMPRCQQLFGLSKATNEFSVRRYSEKGNTSFLFLNGVLRLKGGFKEEYYFNQQEHRLIEKLQESGYLLKCESLPVNEKSNEQTADNSCSEPMAIRLSGMVNKYRNPMEESFFSQEQKSLFDNVLGTLAPENPAEKSEGSSITIDSSSDDDDMSNNSNDVSIRVCQGDVKSSIQNEHRTEIPKLNIKKNEKQTNDDENK